MTRMGNDTGHDAERIVLIAASRADVFARLDDQTQLAEHMREPSAMMGGGRMSYTFDEGRGQAVGSHIFMSGSAFGITVSVDEVIVERVPPSRKSWKTVAHTRLIIIDGYEMGFELAEAGDATRLHVWLDYELPAGWHRWFVALLAALYARWCVERMATDAATYFSPPPVLKG